MSASASATVQSGGAVGIDPEQFRQRQRALHQIGAKVASLKEYLVSLDKRKQAPPICV